MYARELDKPTNTYLVSQAREKAVKVHVFRFSTSDQPATCNKKGRASKTLSIVLRDNRNTYKDPSAQNESFIKMFVLSDAQRIIMMNTRTSDFRLTTS